MTRGVMAAVIIGGAWLCACAAAAALPVTKVAPGVFVHVGAVALASPANRGDIANIGFIVGSRCVAVIDTGGSFAVGAALRAAIHAQTALPVCYVINTHMHPDHIFGNAAFVSDHPQFVAAANEPRALAARSAYYLQTLRREVGTAAAGTTVVPPTLTVGSRRTIDLGHRKLLLRAWPPAHTDNDLTVYDDRTGTLWLADLLFVDHIPVIDGNLGGWLAVIAELRKLHPRHVVPGHGPLDVPWLEALAREAGYLTAIRDQTRQAIRNGVTLRQAAQEVGQDQRGHWALFDDFNARNVITAYSELEWE
jgi:quinoprotein relay system zinc metallohydrolase 2